jgi:predicted ArsR family transcriptional regulator
VKKTEEFARPVADEPPYVDQAATACTNNAAPEEHEFSSAATRATGKAADADDADDTHTDAAAIRGVTSITARTTSAPARAVSTASRAAVVVDPTGALDGRTRDRVADLLLQHGAATVSELSHALGLSSAGVRRHLDGMQAEGLVQCRERPSVARRGRGRPARVFALTEAARDGFGHTYDGLAAAALRWIAEEGGAPAVARFAEAQVIALEERCRAAMAEADDDPFARAEALAGALTAEGYAAGASTIASGGQLCQHHCPVAHVAAEFPQLCEAETQVISRLVGTHVQRLATIANGDGVCTTHIPKTVRTER